MTALRIIWADDAKKALKTIHAYYKKKSVQGANNVKRDLLEAPKTIHFSKQYQIDEVNPEYRRIIVRDYKILYIEKNKEIRVMDIISTKQSPEVLSKK